MILLKSSQEYIIDEIEKSEKFETDIFFQMAKKFYDECDIQSQELFDIAIKKTNYFTNITPNVFVEDSRLIKIFRYCLLPVVSQMKLGQLIGLSTTSEFENNIIKNGNLLLKLNKLSNVICDFFIRHMDWKRFIWLQTKLTDEQRDIAIQYAKRWTCSLIANQNSSTAFRNWRKELQETTIAEQIVKAGYSSTESQHCIESIDDLLPGQFSRECCVNCGRITVKADVAIRLKKSRKLLLIEAKAIGVRIDSYKRLKECREKFAEWRKTYGENVIVGTVLSGFMHPNEVLAILEYGAVVFWEYKENELYDYLAKEQA